MTTNSRFISLDNGVQVEALAEHIQLLWNPTTGSSTVIFNSRNYIKAHDKFTPFGDEVALLRVNLDGMRNRCLASAGMYDPFTGVDLSQVSIAGIEMLIKVTYDRLHNEDAAARQARLDSLANPPEGEAGGSN